MEVTDALLIEVVESSQVSDARRRITNMASEVGLDQKAVDRVALVCTELATNLVKHTSGGVMIAQGLINGNDLGIEIFALDKGPGMDSIDSCLKDGFSTVGTYGNGLGAIKRMSDSMDISSAPNQGTIIQSRIWVSKIEHVDCNVGGITVPLNGELLSGDKWATCKIDDGLYCVLVDGLGHGFEAAEAAKLAIKRFRENLTLPPGLMLKEMHQALRGSRGAVGAVAKINYTERQLVYAGLGNIGGMLVKAGERKHLTSLNGTLGYEARKISEFSFPWSEDTMLVMHSDGLSSRVSDDPALLDENKASAALVAAALYFNQTKTTDDSTILVVKQVG